MPTNVPTLAVIGAGPSTLYLLQNLLTHEAARLFASITVFDARDRPGVGMPYSRETTGRHNLCNISSDELPSLPETFEGWLRARDEQTLRRYGLAREDIDGGAIYERVVLGDYFEAQFEAVIQALSSAGLPVHWRPGVDVTDIEDQPESNAVLVVTREGRSSFDHVVISTGHRFDGEDQPRFGYFASPWPIDKILPPKGTHHDFTVATLGASLSAFDVVSSLAHRHGRFEPSGSDGPLTFHVDERCPNFRITLHDANGWLPHLQYAQTEPMREVYRHVTPGELLELRDDAGFLRLDAYFERVCRPTLLEALRHDGEQDLARALGDGMTLEAFVAAAEESHTYDDPFDGMRSELPEARRSLDHDRPIRWKEVLDDLMYTLNFHAELIPAEDHERWREVVRPLLMNVIAALPLPSARTLLALRDAGRLELVAGPVELEEIGSDGTRVSVEGEASTYRMFISCGGQSPVTADDYPFRTMLEVGTIRSARARHVDGGNPEPLVGIDIDGTYRVIGDDGLPNRRIHDIGFPHTAGLRPYSYGLQACNLTASMVVAGWLREDAP